MRKRTIAIRVLTLLLLAALVVPMLVGCDTQADAWEDDVYFENLYVWSGAAWVKIIGAGGAGLWEVDGAETQLIIADAIDMQSHKIINVVDPTANQEAATKKYVDDNAGVSLWEVDGAETQIIIADEIDMQTKKIINIVDPTNNQDAATKKYVDDNIVTDHGALGGLADDDHSQYILHSLAAAANDFLIASGANTFVKRTLAETGAILEADLDHGSIQGLAGDDHPQYIKDSEFTQDSGILVGTGAGTFIEETGAVLRASIDTLSTAQIAAAIDADVAAHSALTTGVHGAGADYVALFGTASTVVSKFTTLAAATVLWRRNLIENSCFVAKIHAGGVGGLTATNVPYDTDSRELSLPDPSTNPQYGKVVLHNTTRGNSRLITDVDTTNNVLTTDSSTDNWADNDDITTRSQTCLSASPTYFFDVDISGEIPATATAVFIYISITNLSAVTVQNQNMVLWHPYSAFAGGKLGGNRVACGFEHNTIYSVVPVLDRKICIGFGQWGAICAAGITPIFRIMGYWE